RDVWKWISKHRCNQLSAQRSTQRPQAASLFRIVMVQDAEARVVDERVAGIDQPERQFLLFEHESDPGFKAADFSKCLIQDHRPITEEHARAASAIALGGLHVVRNAL